LLKPVAFFPDNRNFVWIIIALEYHAPWKSAREARSCGVMEDEDVEGVEILDNSSIRIKHVASLKDVHAAGGDARV
jgi:hypothetical protein